MKGRELRNLLVVGSVAAGCAWYALKWGTRTYADPTCRRYAAAHGMTYTSFDPPYWHTPSSGHNDGNCLLTGPKGADHVGLYTASGKDYGPPFLVGFALRFDLMFLWSFIGTALVWAMFDKVTGRGKKVS